MSPEPLPAVLPMRARPMVALQPAVSAGARSSGASVAITMMIEPVFLGPQGALLSQTDRHADDAQLPAQTVVSLYQDADDVPSDFSLAAAMRFRCRP